MQHTPPSPAVGTTNVVALVGIALTTPSEVRTADGSTREWMLSVQDEHGDADIVRVVQGEGVDAEDVVGGEHVAVTGRLRGGPVQHWVEALSVRGLPGARRAGGAG